MANSDDDQATESSSSYEEDERPGAAADFMGNLKTALIWDTGRRQLCFRLRQAAENGRRTCFKYKGLLNSATGEFSSSGYVQQKLLSNSPLTLERVLLAAEEERRGVEASDPDINPNRFLPAGVKTLLLEDWILAPGLSFNSGSQRKLQYALTLAKAPQFLVHSPKFDCWLSGKAGLEVDPKTAQVTSSASLRLKLLRYNVTQKQDVRLVVGLDVAGSGKQWKQLPYVKLSENNLALKLQSGSWSVLYEM